MPTHHNSMLTNLDLSRATISTLSKEIKKCDHVVHLVFTAWPLGSPRGASRCSVMWQKIACSCPNSTASLAGWGDTSLSAACVPTRIRWLLGAAWCFTLGTSSEPSACVHLTHPAYPHTPCPGATSAVRSRALRSVLDLRRSLQSPTVPTQGHLQHHWLCRWSHRAGMLWQLHLRRTGQSRRDGDSVDDNLPGDGMRAQSWLGLPGECPNRSMESPWGQPAPWHPNKGWKQSGNFTLSMAVPAPRQPCLLPIFLRLRRKQCILSGETTGCLSTVQLGGAYILETHVWRNEQPNYTDVSAFNHSRSVV